VLLGRLERALEVVQHRQELLHEPLVRTRDQGLLLARGTLAEVVEVGGEPLEVAEVLVPLSLGGGEALVERRLFRTCLGTVPGQVRNADGLFGRNRLSRLVGGHDRFAVSSSSMTS
jgi:hypothetical protein